MLGKGVNVDKHIECTVAYLKWCPASRVPEAMRACKFTDAKSRNPAKHDLVIVYNFRPVVPPYDADVLVGFLMMPPPPWGGRRGRSEDEGGGEG